MTPLQAASLGLVQGLTEYLPVSSSAHLVLMPKILGWSIHPKEAFIFDVLVQLGTLVGVLLYFSSYIRDMSFAALNGLIRLEPFKDSRAKNAWLVILATIPATILGLLFKDQVAAYFSSPLVACYSLMATGLLMITAELVSKKIEREVNSRDAISIGMAQSLALLPGISRSGSTIACGMALGLTRFNAARFSFLMSIPVMLGASLVASLDLFNDAELLNQMALPLAVGFISAAISGYLVIKWFMDFVAKRSLFLFAFYCMSLGALGVLWF